MARSSCLVLDLDETLVHTMDSGDDYKRYVERAQLPQAVKSRVYAFFIDGLRYWGARRPYLPQFLDVAFTQVDIVGVWSAGEGDYVRAVVDRVFTRQKPHFVWTREQCKLIHIGTNLEDYYKPLSLLFKSYPSIDPHNTLIVDDKHKVATYNSTNLVEVPSYKPKPQNLALHDDALLKLSIWLRDATNAKVPLALQDKSHIFVPREPESVEEDTT